MDMQMEDKYVKQIEQNLSKQMEMDLFATGKINRGELRPRNLDPVREAEPVRELVPVRKTVELIGTRDLLSSNLEKEPVVETRDIALGPMITRAEYIRQAREACMRQMNETQYAPQQNQVDESANIGLETMYPRHRRREESYWNTPAARSREEDTPQELASFRSLVIRTACAAFICAAVIVIDLLDIKIGGVSTEVVREYVVGKDYLRSLEEAITTFIKK